MSWRAGVVLQTAVRVKGFERRHGIRKPSQMRTFTTSLAMAKNSILKRHQFGYSWFSTSLEECRMKRFVSLPLIIAALVAAVVLLPISEAQAETADEVRKRAFAVLVKLVLPRHYH